MYVVLDADWTDSTGSATDVGLSFSVDVSAIYEVEVVLACLSDATTTGLHWMLVEPAAGVTWSAQWISSPLTFTTVAWRHAAMGTASAPATSPSATQTWLALGRGMVRTNASGSGTVKIQAHSEVAASTVTIRKGSFMRYRRLA